MRHLNDLDVEALNLVLAADTELATVVFARLGGRPRHGLERIGPFLLI
jgi:hypothetical protein